MLYIYDLQMAYSRLGELETNNQFTEQTHNPIIARLQIGEGNGNVQRGSIHSVTTPVLPELTAVVHLLILHSEDVPPATPYHFSTSQKEEQPVAIHNANLTRIRLRTKQTRESLRIQKKRNTMLFAMAA